MNGLEAFFARKIAKLLMVLVVLPMLVGIITWLIISICSAVIDGEEFLHLVADGMAPSAGGGAIVNFVNYCMKVVPFFSDVGDTYIESILESALGSGPVFFGLGALKAAYDCFVEGALQSPRGVILSVLEGLAQAMIANYIIYILLGISRFFDKLFCQGNIFLKVINVYLTHIGFGLSGFWCAWAITESLKRAVGGDTAYSIVIIIVGFICILLQALTQSGVIGVIFSLITGKRVKVSNRIITWEKLMTAKTPLEKKLGTTLFSLFAKLLNSIVNTILLWLILICISFFVRGSVSAAIGFYLYLILFVVLLFIENRFYKSKKRK